MIREVLRMEKVTYKEQGRILLDNFNITVRKGEVFGLIPVNRYGMDAFLKLLQQNMPLHYGYVYYREQLVNQWQRSHNRTNRISIIRNKSSLAEDLTVVDNIFVLRRGFHKYLIHPGMLERLLQPFLDEIGINIPAGAYVSELTIFQKFVTEVLKAVVAGSQLIVLENVSTFISESELEELHRIIRLYAERGISVIYITAHFEEATYLCDRMALMVNGQIIKTFQRGDPIPDTFPLQSVEEYDRWVRSQHRRQEADTDRQTVLIMDKIQYGNLKDITIRVGQGECVVLQDLDNRCIADFVELFQGEIPEKGSFYLTKGTQKSEKNRDIAVIQELPTETMLFPHMSYFDNLCFTMDHRIRGVWNQSGIRRSIQEEQKDLLGEDVFDTPVWNLTRQQKYDLVYTRILMQHPQVVLCVQPFKNAEVSVRSHIWELMERFLKKNIAVVILAVNLADSLALADRQIRIRNGQIQEIYDQKDFSRLPEHTPWLHLYQKTYGNRSEDKK